MNRFPSLALATLAAIALTACTPTLDWREARLGELQLLFPCKPDRVERSVQLAQGTVPAQMLVCDAGEMTWSATHFPLQDATPAQDVLPELHDKLLANLRGSDAPQPAPRPPAGTAAGVTTTAADVLRRSLITGKRPDGSVAQADAVWLAHGAQAYQLVVLSRAATPAAAQAGVTEFIESWRWSR